MVKCAICTKNVKEAERITCSKCPSTAHFACIGLSQEDINLKKKWTCPVCKPSTSKRREGTPVAGESIPVKSPVTTPEVSSVAEQLNDLKKQAQMEDVDNRSRACNVEIRGIPEDNSEDLLNHLDKICSTLNVHIERDSIYTAYRTGKKKGDNKHRAIVYMFKNFFPRNDLLRACKEYNRAFKEPGKRLQTADIGISGMSQQIYISEHLTPKTKYLLSQSKLKKQSLGYKYCWVSNGRIFLKKDSGSETPTVWVKDLKTLTELNL
ncbi:PHD-finger domain-containing protein [Phthorimaea operculella]|nr:PHD-finger domain-containing protein [Phthorimaea operculella]